MKQNRLGTTGVYASEIGFGCMSLPLDEAESTRILQRAVELGVTFFDTADLYDHGKNEALVGTALKAVRKDIVLASKVGNRWNDDGNSWHWDASAGWIKEAVYQSLERLQTDYLDLYQLHGGTLEDDLEASFAAFEALKAEGVIRAYGISSIRPNVIRQVVKLGVSSNMMQYSLLDRRPEETALDVLVANTVSVIVRGGVAKGLLASKPAAPYLDHSEAEVARIQQGLEGFVTPERTKAQLALRFTLGHPAVATVIPGASSVKQLEENVAAANIEVSNRELEALRALIPAYTYQQHR